MLVSKSFTVIALTLQNAPEAFHWTIVNTVSHAGHTLCHTGFFNFMMESTVRVLVSTVTVKQRMCVWITLDGFIKGLKCERIVITLTDYESYDAPVIEV